MHFTERSFCWFNHYMSMHSLRWIFGTFQSYAYCPILCVLHKFYEVRTRRAGCINLRLRPWTPGLSERRRLLSLPFPRNNVQRNWHDWWKILDGCISDGWLFVHNCNSELFNFKKKFEKSLMPTNLWFLTILNYKMYVDLATLTW